MLRDGGRKEQEKWLGSRDARSKSIPPIQGCRQEACSSSAINLACVMAERARCRSFLDEESRASIISFVHRLPGEIPLTGRIEEIAEASASAAAATTSRSGNRRSLYLLFVLLLAFVPTYEQSKNRESLDEPSARILNT
ncbi:unnamed protein product [Lasius platythorax]|uniref:Uncharacterized protein n=1 Tax=Lasius platythorax TaxID=488582 RepID=A0AAV2NT98_9HYME